MEPPYENIMEKLIDEDFLGAVTEWQNYCESPQGKSHNYRSYKDQPHIWYAKTLSACLLGKSMGGIGLSREVYHFESQKIQMWISEITKNRQPVSIYGNHPYLFRDEAKFRLEHENRS